MNATELIATEIAKVLSGNDLYNSYRPQWKYLLESYLGGDEYRQAGHLVRYRTESDAEYDARLGATPLENHCQSVVDVYTSFLFREHPYRDLGRLDADPMLDDFLRDCDWEGRTLNHFMRDLSNWVSVFGHAWMIVAKPNVGASNRGEEIAQGVRPYLSMLTPLVVKDWEWTRLPSGKYELSYLKYIEEINGDVSTVKEWTPDVILTTVVNENANEIVEKITEDNELGEIPCVLAYNKRSSVRGIGVSDIRDIADKQKFIYNATSEVDQSIRLNTHPSLVKTENTQAGIGAGSIIQIDESSDPGLKPYLLEFTGASVGSIYEAINHAVDAIDKMANTGAIRQTESRKMSGVAIETEFQLLNSRLADKAKSIELAEEQMWKLWCKYMGYDWDGTIMYPMSFNIRDSYNDLDFYVKALGSGVPSKTYKDELFKQIAEVVIDDSDLLNQIKNEIQEFTPHVMYNSRTGESIVANNNEEHISLAQQGWTHEQPVDNNND